MKYCMDYIVFLSYICIPKEGIHIQDIRVIVPGLVNTSTVALYAKDKEELMGQPLCS